MKDSYKNKLFILQETNYYKILGVKESAPIESIVKEYRYLVKLVHPDKHLNIPQAEKNDLTTMFKKVNQAYEVIKDDEQRKIFDLELKQQRDIEEEVEKRKVAEKPKEPVKTKAEPEKKTELPVNKPVEPIRPPKVPENLFKVNSPIKNDPRLKNASGGFTFGINMSENPDPENARKLRNEKEHEQNTITFNQAKMYIRQQNYDEAIVLLKKLIEKKGKEASYHSALGQAMEAKGWASYAEAQYKVALHYDPNDVTALNYFKRADLSGETIKVEINKTANSGPAVKTDSKGVFGKFKSFFNKG
jgi:curved DNA-binding protein CbpA